MSKKRFVIVEDFDLSKTPVGFVEIDEKFARSFPAMSLSPAYTVKLNEKDEREVDEILHFGLVPTEQYIKAFDKNNKATEIL